MFNKINNKHNRNANLKALYYIIYLLTRENNENQILSKANLCVNQLHIHNCKHD